MFVMTAKLSKPKLLALGILLLGAVALVIVLLKGGQQEGAPLPKGENDGERAAYLASFGWSIDPKAKESMRVKIPDTGDNQVFSRYNDLQLSQGFDLRPYGGKEVMRYVYEILNYEDSQSAVYAALLVYEGRIIGGDITDTAPQGVMHGFKKPAKLGGGKADGQPVADQGEAGTETAEQATQGAANPTGSEGAVPSEGIPAPETDTPESSTAPSPATEGNEPT